MSTERDGVDTEDDTTWRRAAQRFSYQLHYVRSPTARTIDHGGTALTGPDIENAYNDQPPPTDTLGRPYERLRLASGWWEEPDAPTTADGRTIHSPTIDDYLRKYVGMAIGEAVHEALEWTRVDGRPYLDPHGVHQQAIHAAVHRMVEQFHELAAQPQRPPAPRRRRHPLGDA